jgi:hypothetical protein
MITVGLKATKALRLHKLDLGRGRYISLLYNADNGLPPSETYYDGKIDDWQRYVAITDRVIEKTKKGEPVPYVGGGSWKVIESLHVIENPLIEDSRKARVVRSLTRQRRLFRPFRHLVAAKPATETEVNRARRTVATAAMHRIDIDQLDHWLLENTDALP